MPMRFHSGCCLFALCILATACRSQEPDLQKHSLQEHSLREFMDVREIKAVEAHNYSGHHWLTAAEMHDFKKRFGTMHYLPGGSGQVKSVDMGTTVFVLHTHGRAYRLIGHPLRPYLGVPGKLVTQNWSELAVEDQKGETLLLFEFTQPTNLNNYRKGPTMTSRRK